MAKKRNKRAPGRKSGRRPKETPDWAPAFLAALAREGTVRAACDAAPVAPSTVYQRRQSDPAFDLAMAEALELATDRLEREAIRRGCDGYEEPVIHQGQLMGRFVDAAGQEVPPGTPGALFVPLTVRRYSDSLLANLLRWRRYGDSVNHTHSGPGGGPIQSEVSHDVGERLAPYAAVIAGFLADGGGAVRPDGPAQPVHPPPAAPQAGDVPPA